jgi:hypothetical protein
MLHTVDLSGRIDIAAADMDRAVEVLPPLPLAALHGMVDADKHDIVLLGDQATMDVAEELCAPDKRATLLGGFMLSNTALGGPLPNTFFGVQIVPDDYADGREALRRYYRECDIFGDAPANRFAMQLAADSGLVLVAGMATLGLDGEGSNRKVDGLFVPKIWSQDQWLQHRGEDYPKRLAAHIVRWGIRDYLGR